MCIEETRPSFFDYQIESVIENSIDHLMFGTKPLNYADVKWNEFRHIYFKIIILPFFTVETPVPSGKENESEKSLEKIGKKNTE